MYLARMLTTKNSRNSCSPMRIASPTITPKIPAHAPFATLCGLSRSTCVNEIADATAAPPIADVK